MPAETLLIVDDEEDMLHLLQRSLGPELGCETRVANSAEAALKVLGEDLVDLALIDIKMPGMDGLELLDILRREHPWLTVVMMTAHGCIDVAVQAIKKGAYDFITKPFDHDELVISLTKAMERNRLLRENIRLQRRCLIDDAFRNMVGQSSKMQRVFETLRMVAETDFTVLITGESGTGKDLAARAIHDLSNRRDAPFVPVNCPTVPENILESELFGYRKGAFTHATQNKIGLFQEAHRGSIFLDEIGDISPGIQTKLLRVLQEKTIKPLGDTKTIHVDVRVIASTNRNLPEKIKRGEFREDLFYRLNVLPVLLPPLRERREDIPLLVSHFLTKHCSALNRPVKSFSPDLMEHFLRLPWEGNIRELENAVIRGILFSSEGEVKAEDLGLKDGPAHAEAGPASSDVCETGYKAAKEESLRRFHEEYLGKILSATQGNVTQAARACGMERQALQQIIRRYNINPDRYRTEGSA